MSLLRKIYFEEADRPPPSYYKKGESLEPSRMPFQTPDPQKWLQAPEFVPRARQMVSEAFNESPPPFDPTLPPLGEMSGEYSGDGIYAPHPEANPIIEESYMPGIPSDMMGVPSQMFNNPPHHFYPPVSFPGGGLSRGSLPPVLPSLLPPHPFPMPFPGQQMPGRAPPPFSIVPNGYSANITNINPGLGPPIPAIVLKKKRRKRNKNHTQSMLIDSDSKDSESPPAPLDPNEVPCHSNIEDIEEEPTAKSDIANSKVIGGSCPDLTEEQLDMWDDYLYEHVVENQKQRRPPPSPSPMTRSQEKRVETLMQTSGVVNPAYEIVPRAVLDVAEQAVDGITNPEIRRLEREINGNVMTASTVLTKLKEKYEMGIDADGSTEKSLASEIEEISFKPQISKYGYPQYDNPHVHLATFHPDAGVQSAFVNMKKDNCVEDCFEKMNIRVNAFDDTDDLQLSESECPPPSRLQQLQWALRNQKNVALHPPERVCCTIS